MMVTGGGTVQVLGESSDEVDSCQSVLRKESGQDKVHLGDRPALFRSAAWEHYGYSVT